MWHSWQIVDKLSLFHNILEMHFLCLGLKLKYLFIKKKKHSLKNYVELWISNSSHSWVLGFTSKLYCKNTPIASHDLVQLKNSSGRIKQILKIELGRWSWEGWLYIPAVIDGGKICLFCLDSLGKETREKRSALYLSFSSPCLWIYSFCLFASNFHSNSKIITTVFGVYQKVVSVSSIL